MWAAYAQVLTLVDVYLSRCWPWWLVSVSVTLAAVDSFSLSSHDCAEAGNSGCLHTSCMFRCWQWWIFTCPSFWYWLIFACAGVDDGWCVLVQVLTVVNLQILVQVLTEVDVYNYMCRYWQWWIFTYLYRHWQELMFTWAGVNNGGWVMCRCWWWGMCTCAGVDDGLL